MLKVSKSPIVITGGAQRIGFHCALRFAEIGQPVVISYRTPRDTLEKLDKAGVSCIAADFSQPEGVEAFARTLNQRFDKIRAIIHNASSWHTESEGIDPADLMQRMTQIHMVTPYLINRLCHKLLVANKPEAADIIHITDCVVEKGSYSHIAYSASKAGMDNMTRSFAKNYAPDIKVNAVAPALIMFNEGDTPDYQQHALNKSLLKIEPGPEVVFETLCFLLNSSYITGRTIGLDGGRHIK